MVKDMKERQTLLCVLSSERGAEKTAAFAIKTAREKSYNIHLLYVLEETSLYYLNRMNEAEFMSKKLSAELSESLMREKRQHGYKIIEKIIADAKKEGINVKSTILSGDIIDITLKIAGEISASEIVISWHKESYIKKLFKGDPVENLRKFTGLPVTAITE